jgi:hypothetical protein
MAGCGGVRAWLVAFQVLWIACAGIEIPEVEESTSGEPLVPSIDWEALIQSGASANEKFSVAGDVGVSADFKVGGAVKVTREMNTKGKATFESDVDIRGKTLNHGGAILALGQLDGLKQLNKRGNRALMHHSSPTDSLHMNYDGDFEGGVVVGGPKTLIQGTLVSKGVVVAEKDLDVRGSTVMVGKGDGKKQGSRSKNRAVAHGDSDMLLVNQEGDFEGGTHVQGKGLFAEGRIGIGKGNTNPQADLHISTAADSAQVLLSHTRNKKNSVFVKGVAGAAQGIDMVVGSTAGAAGYGRLLVDFKSDITFLGTGRTLFKRGDLIVDSGKVAIGKRAAGSKSGLTLETDAKPGDEANDLAVNRGKILFHGSLVDISSKDDKWHLDLDQGGHIKAVNVATKLGIGTKIPSSQFGDNDKALLHMVDKGRPVVTLESQSSTGHASVVLKTGKSQFVMDHTGTTLKFSSGSSDMLVLDSQGKVGIGRANVGKYGVNVHLAEGANNPLNDLALPHGNIRMQGKIYSTFSGGDSFYVDPSQLSNMKSLNLDDKLSFKGVRNPKYHIEIPKGDAHISLGDSIFLNGFGGDAGRITNNAVVDSKGAWGLRDKGKLASAIELKNTGVIEMFGTKQVGKMNWQFLFGMDGPSNSVFAFGKFGIGTKKPQHTFHMGGGENTMSLGNNMFLAGAGTVSRMTSNAYIKDKQWVIQRKDRFASSIELKSSGKVEMYGTQTPGAVQWKKMFGFDAPKKTVYAFGKLGIDTEKPTHTLTIPSGAHHISLGDKMFLNGQGAKTRIMGNCLIKLGKVEIQDKSRQGINIEMDSGAGELKFGGTQSKGSNAFLQLMKIDFTKKVVAVESGRLGVRTAQPKTSLDVRGHLHLQDTSSGGVIYTPSSGPGLFLRASDSPGKYSAASERFFFGNNHRAGFGTNKPQAKLHISHTKADTQLAHLKLETAGAVQYDIHGTKAGLNFQTSLEGQQFKFRAGAAVPLEMSGKASEATVNGAKYKESVVALVPGGGRVAVGGAPKSQHALSVFGNGVLLAGGKGSKGVMAFSNDGGGSGFEMGYSAGKMRFSSLSPTKHLKLSKAQTTHMAITDDGKVGIGTETPTSALSIKSNDGITVENKAGAKWTYRTSKDGHLEFVSNKGGFFKVDNAGGMHLSKKTSKYKLEVAGTGMMLSGDSEGKAPLVFNADGGGKGFRMDYYKEKMMLGHGDGKKWHMTMTDAGLVGVGTPSPTSGVHVKHDSGIAIEHGSKSQKWTVFTHANANLDFGYMGSTKVSYTKAGYVGIGTTAPKKMLHVEGDVYIAGKMHLDNWYTKKLQAKAAKPKLEMLDSAEALIQLDEHVSARMGDGSVGLVHKSKEAQPVDLSSLVTYMHRVVQEQQAQIRELKARVSHLETKA